MKLFAALRHIRHFERAQLPFLKSIVDFDIVIEIGYAEEMGQPRRLARLIGQGIVKRRKNSRDQRSSLLTVSSSSLKMLGKYGGILTATFAALTS